MDLARSDMDDTLRKSFAIIQQLKQQLAKAKERENEPIAVVGMGCRFPGGAHTPEAFWELLSNGAETVREIPEDRWDWRQFYHPNAEIPGTHYVRHGSFVDQVDQFDPDFFGISGREADDLDPQHRLLLEVSWEALERAGLATSRLRHSQTGVYVGVGQNDYAQLQLFCGQPERISAYDGTGASFCFASARLSYILGLHGPNMAVDTACSSSLVALHLACQGLRNRECEQALAGGVHLVLSPEVTIYLSRLKALSPDGRCKTFSADADGYGRGEGCGMLVLKRLSDARRDGDRILALLRGTAVNHNGPSSGLTVPNGLAQQQLLREALERAAISPADVGWIEAHGTGTSLGDPIEAAALAEVFPRDNRDGRPLYLSSVKTNIGHLEAAAGIAGVIKVILAMQHGEIPPHLHLGQPNPHVNWEGSCFHIPTVRTAWPGPERRIAGVSAFGLGGTNAHIILSDSLSNSEQKPVTTKESDGAGYLPLVLSARTSAALTELVVRYAEFLRRTDVPFADVAWTAAGGRKHFEYRIAVAGKTASETAERLSLIVSRDNASSRVPDAPPKIAFLFSGQGSQYCGMGRELLRSVPAFREAVLRCAELVQKEAGWSPLSFLADESIDPRLDQTEYTQASLFTLQYALVCMWRTWGIEPDMVLGHSIGEFAAAWSADVLSLEEAVRLVVCRGRLMQRLPKDGGMAGVRMSEVEALAWLADYRDHLWIAAVNGPRAVVIAGADAKLDACLAGLQQAGVPSRRLPVSHAFHTPRMEPMLAEFAAVANATRFATPKIDFLPTGARTDAVRHSSSAASPDYWIGQILNPVRFAEAAAGLAPHKADIVLEIGPSGSLLPLARQCAGLPPDALWLPSLERTEESTVFKTLGRLYERGCEIGWSEVFDRSRRFAPVPTYPFQRRRCWVAGKPSKAAGGSHWRNAKGHPLLGARMPSALAEKMYTARISASEPAFLRDHQVQGDIVFPAAGFVEMALTATTEHFRTEQIRLRDIEFHRPLQFSGIAGIQAGVRLQTVLTPSADHCAIRVYSLADSDGESGEWREHMSCTAQPLPEGVEICDPAEGRNGSLLSCATGAEFYAASRARGIDYGPAFQSLLRLDSFTGDRGCAEFARRRPGDAAWTLDPLILDAALQALAAARPDLSRRTFVPAAIESLDFTPGATPEGRILCHVEGGLGVDDLTASLCIADKEGSLRVRLQGIRMRQIGLAANEHAPIWIPVWAPVKLPIESGPLSGHWLVLGDDAELGHLLAALLTEGGATTTTTSVPQNRLTEPDSLRRLLDDIAQKKGEITGVCYLAVSNATIAPPIEAPWLAELALVQALGLAPEAEQPQLLLVTRGAQEVEAAGGLANPYGSGVWGLGRVARNEFPRLRCVCVDLDPISTDDECASALLTECAAGDGDEDQVAWRNGTRHALRLRADDREFADAARPVPVQSASGTLTCTRTGDLDSLSFQPTPVQPLRTGEVRVRVRAAGLNFKDVLHALGVLEMPADSGFGFDAAGVVEAVGPGETRFTAGDRVMLTLTPGSIADSVHARAEFVCRIPPNVTFAEAAGIPLVFLTAWYALVNVAHVEAGKRVLIHAGAGGVGQAAIQIARHLGAEVFITASPAKQRLLREQGWRHVYSSRSSLFCGQILDATDGQGVDAVLNSLNGELIPAGFGCLREGGRFIEIGKVGIWTREEAQKYRSDVRYTPFDLAEVARERPQRIQEMLDQIAAGIASGVLRPIQTRTFPANSVADGFRLIARSRHAGKVVILMPRTISAESSGTHLITGGFGALARSLCGHLVVQGARNIALVARSEPNPERCEFLEMLRQQGVRARVYVADLGDADAVEEVIRRVADDFPEKIRAVYHTAGVLADAAISNQTPESFARVAAPKLAGAWNLHRSTLALDLERFVLFSSAAAIVGTPGQSNYAAANAALDALAAVRHAAGLPALSINWGPWGGGAGMAARLSDADRHRMKAAGVIPLREDLAWTAMAHLLRQGTTQAVVMSADWSRFAAQLGNGTPSSLFRELSPPRQPSTAGAGILEEIATIPTSGRRNALVRRLQQLVGAILGKPDPEAIRPAQGFFAMGMDSLTSMELRNRLQGELNCVLPATLAFDYGSIEALAGYLMQRIPAWVQAPTASGSGNVEEALLRQLPEADLAELLAHELGGI